MNTYQQRATQTRSRRSYPTPAQRAALCKANQRGGRKLLTRDELTLLATHPYLLPDQRAEFAALAQAAA